MSDHNTPAVTVANPRRRKVLPILAVVLTTGFVAAAATTSFGQGFGPGNGGGPGYGRGMMGGGPDGAGPGFGPGWGRGGGPGFWRGNADNFDPAAMEARIDRRIRHAAVELGANAEQQEKLSTIAKAAMKDLLPVREKMVTARKQARDLLTADKIDRAALEKLRADQIATHEAASKRLVQALADAAEVLTPEQRKKLDTMLPTAGRGGRGWGRGHGMGGGMMGGWGMGGWR
jgi:periplasmic protein CpxP/Spy